jgi:hypothetical protein
MKKNLKTNIIEENVLNDNFKGIYQKNKKKPRYYEGNAHFSYLVLCKKLELIASNIKIRQEIEEKIMLRRVI